MAAPVNYLADLIGNALHYINTQQPQIRQLGHGTGLAYDLAKNAPQSTAYNFQHYASEEEPKK
jgi:hypothetical protein